MFGFLNKPSLASGIAACVAGILLIAVGAFYGGRGMVLATATAWDIPTSALAGAGIVLLAMGTGLVGLGVRALERFERRLMVQIASRGRVQD